MSDDLLVLRASAGGAVGRGTFHFGFLLSPDVRITIERHAGLLLDTGEVPPVREPALGVVVQLVLEGWIEVGSRYGAPAAFSFSESDVEGSSRPRDQTLRASGQPYVAVAVRVPRRLRGEVATSTTPIELSSSTWRAARSLVFAESSKDAALDEAAAALLESLSSDGVLDRKAASLRDAEHFAPLWRGLGPLVERFELTATLDQLGAQSGFSRRTLIRAVQSFLPAVGILGKTWREASYRLRLKCALLLLSAEDASVSEVAAAAGYASAEALGRAFRDAGLDAPSRIQERLRIARRALDTGLAVQ